jgi:hypothetical protein
MVSWLFCFAKIVDDTPFLPYVTKNGWLALLLCKNRVNDTPFLPYVTKKWMIGSFALHNRYNIIIEYFL